MDPRTEFRQAIIEGMARTLWVMAYIEFAAVAEAVQDGLLGPPASATWDDVTPPTPDAAVMAAHDLEGLIAKSLGASPDGIVGLFVRAMTADRGGAPYTLDPAAVQPGPGQDGATELDVAVEFGGAMALLAIGAGGSWFEFHGSDGTFHELALPFRDTFRVEYDGDFLMWRGETEQGTVTGQILIGLLGPAAAPPRANPRRRARRGRR